MLITEYDRDMDIAVNRREAWEDGHEDGLEEGMGKGIEKEKLIIAKNMLEKGSSIDFTLVQSGRGVPEKLRRNSPAEPSGLTTKITKDISIFFCLQFFYGQTGLLFSEFSLFFSQVSYGEEHRKCFSGTPLPDCTSK
jgi:hypothetical protein